MLVRPDLHGTEMLSPSPRQPGTLKQEADIVRKANELLGQYGSTAIYTALDQLNASIDRNDLGARDFWVQVVRLIHEHQ